jgi:hypothetical protein
VIDALLQDKGFTGSGFAAEMAGAGIEITDQMELARHGARAFEGLLTRTAAVLAAHTLLPIELSEAIRTNP